MCYVLRVRTRPRFAWKTVSRFLKKKTINVIIGHRFRKRARKRFSFPNEPRVDVSVQTNIYLSLSTDMAKLRIRPPPVRSQKKVGFWLGGVLIFGG